MPTEVASRQNLQIRVAVALSDDALRDRLDSTISREVEMRCLGSFSTLAEAVAALADETPDVILVDGSHTVATLPDLGEIRQRFPNAQVIMLASSADEDLILESFNQGACGLLLVKSPPARVVEAIREAYNGGSPMSPEISRILVKLFQRLGPPDQYGF